MLILLTFRLGNCDRDWASELGKRRYGQATSTHGGKYVYRMKQLPDEIPHVRLIRGVVIVRTERTTRVLELLNRFHVEVHTRTVHLVHGTGGAWNRRGEFGHACVSLGIRW